MDVQWYPGHMTKARRMMEEDIRLVDLVIELVDARIPMSSRNPDIDALCRGKGRVVLLCKADLADPVKTEAFLDFFRQKGFLAAAADARERRAGDVVRRYVQEACREKIARDRARGIVGRPLRAMVAGIPNVGKSTFINSFAGRASAKTGNKPGVTRGRQWIRLDGSVELLDTPGILWPRFDDPAIGMRLALAGAIRDEVLDRQELALWLLRFLETEYPGVVRKKYLDSSLSGAPGDLSGDEDRSAGTAGETGGGDPGDPGEVPAGYTLLLEIARARRLLRRGGEPDAERAAAMLIDDCRNGRIGRISLDRPQEAEAMLAAQEVSEAGALKRVEKAPKGPKAGPGRPAGKRTPRQAGTGREESGWKENRAAGRDRKEGILREGERRGRQGSERAARQVRKQTRKDGRKK